MSTLTNEKLYVEPRAMLDRLFSHLGLERAEYYVDECRIVPCTDRSYLPWVRVVCKETFVYIKTHNCAERVKAFLDDQGLSTVVVEECKKRFSIPRRRSGRISVPSKKELFKQMLELNEEAFEHYGHEKGVVEPMGTVNYESDGTILMIYEFNKCGYLPLCCLEGYGSISWHGHPRDKVNDSLPSQNRMEDLSMLEDLNINKPSFCDLEALVLDQAMEEMIIAVPKGVIVTKNGRNPVTDAVRKRVERKNKIFESHLTIFNLMRNQGIAAYNAGNWMQAVNCLGCDAEFYPKEQILDPEATLSPVVAQASKDVVPKQVEYLKSERFEGDLDESEKFLAPLI